MIAGRRACRLRIPLGRRPVHLPLSVQTQGVCRALGARRDVASAEYSTAIGSGGGHFPFSLSDHELVARAICNFGDPQCKTAVVPVKHTVELLPARDDAEGRAWPAVVGRAAGLVAACGRVDDRSIREIYGVEVGGTGKNGQVRLGQYEIPRRTRVCDGQIEIKLAVERALLNERQNGRAPAKSRASRTIRRTPF